MTNTIFGRGAPDVSFSENLVLEGGLGSLFYNLVAREARAQSTHRAWSYQASKFDAP